MMLNKRIIVVATFVVCATVQTSAALDITRQSFNLMPESTLARNEFLVTGKGGDFAVITKFGDGRTLNDKANNATRFGLVGNEKCYKIDPAAILENTIWYIINNASPIDGISGDVPVRITALHYSVGENSDGSSRLVRNKNDYEELRSFKINLDVENAPKENRVTFWSTVSDLIEISIETSDRRYAQFLNGRYFIVVDERVLSDGLIPACKKVNIIFSWFTK